MKQASVASLPKDGNPGLHLNLKLWDHEIIQHRPENDVPSQSKAKPASDKAQGRGRDAQRGKERDKANMG